MLKYLQVTSKTENLWNKVIDASDCSTPYGHLLWNSLLVKAYPEYKFSGIIGIKGTEPMVIFPLTTTHSMLGGSMHSSILDGFGGPIVRNDIDIKDRYECANEITTYVLARYFHLRLRNSFHILLPPWSNEEIKRSMVNNNFSLEKSFDNNVLDLDKNINEIRQGYSSNHKETIRYTLKQNVLQIREASSPRDCELFFLLNMETMARVNRIPVYNSEFLKMSYTLIENNIGKLYLAEHNGLTVAGAYVLYDKRNIFYWLGASSSSSEYRKLGLNFILIDEVIKFAKTRDFRYFVLGAAPYDSLLRFKHGWGTIFMPNLSFTIQNQGLVYKFALQLKKTIK